MSVISERLSFCTPLQNRPSLEPPSTRCCFPNLEECYFNWGDTYARPIDDRTVEIVQLPRYSSKAQEVFCKILLVLSYITIIVPIVMLIAKAIFRCGKPSYLIQNTSNNNENPNPAFVVEITGQSEVQNSSPTQNIDSELENEPEDEPVYNLAELQHPEDLSAINANIASMTLSDSITTKPEVMSKIRSLLPDTSSFLEESLTLPIEKRWEMLIGVSKFCAMLNTYFREGTILSSKNSLKDLANQLIVSFTPEEMLNFLQTSEESLYFDPPIAAFQSLLKLVGPTRSFKRFLEFFPAVINHHPTSGVDGLNTIIGWSNKIVTIHVPATQTEVPKTAFIWRSSVSRNGSDLWFCTLKEMRNNFLAGFRNQRGEEAERGSSTSISRSGAFARIHNEYSEIVKNLFSVEHPLAQMRALSEVRNDAV